MKKLSMDEALTRILKDYLEGVNKEEIEGIDDLDEEINELVDGAFLEIDEYSTDANNIFLLAGVPLTNGKHLSLNANLVWDDEKEAWFSFFDGSGPNDAYFEADGDGAYTIVWMD